MTASKGGFQLCVRINMARTHTISHYIVITMAEKWVSIFWVGGASWDFCKK